MSSLASNVIFGNNNILRETSFMLKIDPEYRIDNDHLDTFFGILEIAEKTFKAHYSIELVEPYTETVDLLVAILVKHRFHNLAQLIFNHSEEVKKECANRVVNA